MWRISLPTRQTQKETRKKSLKLHKLKKKIAKKKRTGKTLTKF